MGSAMLKSARILHILKRFCLFLTIDDDKAARVMLRLVEQLGRASDLTKHVVVVRLGVFGT